MTFSKAFRHGLRSGFTPNNIAGAVGWWDLGNAASITSSSSRVSQVTDLSGNGNHLVQGTSGKQPLYDSSIGAIQFLAARGDTMATATAPALLAVTVFIVMKQTANGDFEVLGQHNASSYPSWEAHINATTYRMNCQGITTSGNAAGRRTADNGSDTTNIYVWTFTFAGGSPIASTGTIIYRNGTQVDTTNIGAGTPGNWSASSVVFNIGAGGGLNFTGNVYEVALYNSVLATADRNLVENYMRARWGTA